MNVDTPCCVSMDVGTILETVKYFILVVFGRSGEGVGLDQVRFGSSTKNTSIFGGIYY